MTPIQLRIVNSRKECDWGLCCIGKRSCASGKVKKRKVVNGLVVCAAIRQGFCCWNEVKFDDNDVVLVGKHDQPIGTAVFGPVPHEQRKKMRIKIPILAGHIA